MAYTFDEPRLGLQQIAQVNDTVVTAGGTTIVAPPAVLGSIVRAFDPVFGEGEFILLLGVASTVVGSVVRYNATTYQTTLVVNTAVQDVPVAVAMAACTAGQYGWYQISGNAVIKKTAVTVAPNVTEVLAAAAEKSPVTVTCEFVALAKTVAIEALVVPSTSLPGAATVAKSTLPTTAALAAVAAEPADPKLKFLKPLIAVATWVGFGVALLRNT
jgi:hypothetical protein